MEESATLSQDTSPAFSILIGLVSTEDGERIFEVLDSLRNQQGTSTYEVIIADRRQNEVSRRLDEDYPEVNRFDCPANTSLPELRTKALDAAKGVYIIVTEDHCVPSDNWLANIAQAFQDAPDGIAAVGGCVENGVCDTALDWATFLCEYSYFLEPIEEGETTVLAGMNVAYRQSILVEIDRKLLTRGFWETTVHPVLIEKGFKLYSSNRIKLYHSKKFSLALFLRQRFIYSRYYAGSRFQKRQWVKRVLMFAGTLALPVLLIFRHRQQVRIKGRLVAESKRAIPYLMLFYIVWALGEMAGYLLGSGESLDRIE